MQAIEAFKIASCELISDEEAVAGLGAVVSDPLPLPLPLPPPLLPLPEPALAAPGMPPPPELPESPEVGGVHGGFNSNTVFGPKFDPRMTIGAMKVSVGR